MYLIATKDTRSGRCIPAQPTLSPHFFFTFRSWQLLQTLLICLSMCRGRASPLWRSRGDGSSVPIMVIVVVDAPRECCPLLSSSPSSKWNKYIGGSACVWWDDVVQMGTRWDPLVGCCLGCGCCVSLFKCVWHYIMCEYVCFVIPGGWTGVDIKLQGQDAKKRLLPSSFFWERSTNVFK